MTNHHPPLLVRYCHITSTKGYYILFYLFFLCIFSAAYDDPTSSNQGLMVKLQIIVPLYDSWISFKFRLYYWEIYKWSFIDLCWVQQTRCWQPMTKDWVLLKFYCKLISPRWKLKICFKKKKKLSFFLVRLQVQPIEMSLIPSLTDHNHRLSFSDLMWFIKSTIYTHKFL